MIIVTATEIQNNFGKYLQISQHEQVVITKNGKKIASLIPYVEDENIGRWLVSEGSPRYRAEGIKVSYEEFLKLTEDGENRYEYIDGELILLASPLYPHQKAVNQLLFAFNLWFHDKECEPLVSPFDVILYRLGDVEKICSVQPDILVICDQDKIDAKGKYRGTPALVVEVLSESTQSRDMVQKLDLYMESGVQEYWVVNTKYKEVYIHVFANNTLDSTQAFKHGEMAKSQIFSGLQVDLSKVFT